MLSLSSDAEYNIPPRATSPAVDAKQSNRTPTKADDETGAMSYETDLAICSSDIATLKRQENAIKKQINVLMEDLSKLSCERGIKETHAKRLRRGAQALKRDASGKVETRKNTPLSADKIIGKRGFILFKKKVGDDTYNTQCCVCLDNFVVDDSMVKWLLCGHALHKECYIDFEKSKAKGKCPTCRAEY